MIYEHGILYYPCGSNFAFLNFEEGAFFLTNWIEYTDRYDDQNPLEQYAKNLNNNKAPLNQYNDYNQPQQQQPAYNSGGYNNNIYDQQPISNPLKSGFGGGNSGAGNGNQAYSGNRNSGGYTRDQGQYKGTIGANAYGNPTQFQFK